MQLPDLYIFNPTGELAIANGTISYQPSHILLEFEAALASLPAFFAKQSDILLYKEQALSSDFIDFWKRFSVEMPQSISVNEIGKANSDIPSQINGLEPWCWSPAMHQLLQELKPACSSVFLEQPNANWQPQFKELYSRFTAKNILRDVLKAAQCECFLPEEHLPVVCRSESDIDSVGAKWQQLVLKAPWSSSGRGIQVLRSGMKRPVKEWNKGILKQQGYIMAEPLLDKRLDFAFQYRISSGKVDYLGVSYFRTNSNGAYQENLIGEVPTDDPVVLEQLNRLIEKAQPLLTNALEKHLLAKNYEGYLGVDAMLYHGDDSLKLHPCLEINLRYNMGTLALQLQKMIHSGAKGCFRIYYSPKEKFRSFCNKQQEQHPAISKGNKAYKGFYSLSSNLDTRFGAYLELE